MTIPTHLSHQPIVAVDRYDLIDGPFASNTDAQSISLGRAQYDPAHFSAKVFRQVNSQWSRQSEELPMHRVLDLAILIIGAISQRPMPTTNLREQLVDADSIDDLRDYFMDARMVGIFRPQIQELRRLINLPEIVNY